MWWLILEALLAGGLFAFIVWWTMFAGRRRGERQEGRQEGRQEERQDDPPP